MLWALPDPDDALARWVTLLRPGGTVLLVDGSWSTGAGIPADQCQELVLHHRATARVQRLHDATL